MSLRKWEVGEARGSHILNYYSVKAKFFSLPLSRYQVHRHLLYLLVRSSIGTLSTTPLTTLLPSNYRFKEVSQGVGIVCNVDRASTSQNDAMPVLILIHAEHKSLHITPY
jgi:hypothetical protein